MPYANLEKRREYHREYMRKHPQVFTLEQKQRMAERKKKYAQENAEKLKEYQRNRQMRDKARIAERKKKREMEHPEIRKTQSKNYWAKPEVKYRVYKKGANTRGMDFSLSSDEFNKLLFSDCHYCGQREAFGVDRKDNSKGYLSYNVVACCKTCNFMKGTLNYVEFLEQIQKIIKNLLT